MCSRDDFEDVEGGACRQWWTSWCSRDDFGDEEEMQSAKGEVK